MTSRRGFIAALAIAGATGTAWTAQPPGIDVYLDPN
jgi:hypothetical protein